MAALCISAVAACTPTPADHPRDQAYDPYEADNRRVHEFNKAFDRNLFQPVSKGYSAFMPDDIEDMIGRFSFNLSIPGAVVNNILQGNMKGATEDTYRFLVNSTIGFFGFFDAASELTAPAATDADFGQTLHVWGVREGAYVELPILGASTERDTAGMVVDLFTSPLSYFIDQPASYVRPAAWVSDNMSNRGRFSDTIDSILYESADSYAQTKSLYIQNRRFELGGDSADGFADPYDDPYGAPSED